MREEAAILLNEIDPDEIAKFLSYFHHYERKLEILSAIQNIDMRTGVGVKLRGIPDILWMQVEAEGMVFEISKYPVSNLQFCTFLEDTEAVDDSLSLNETFSEIRGAPGNIPVTGITWFEAIRFCNWLHKKLELTDAIIRLPDPDEWEAAAYGIDIAKQEHEYPIKGYPVGHQEVRDSPIPVGIFPKSESATHVSDLMGNIWEMTSKRADDITNEESYFSFGGEWTEVTRILRVNDRYKECGFRVVKIRK